MTSAVSSAASAASRRKSADGSRCSESRHANVLAWLYGNLLAPFHWLSARIIKPRRYEHIHTLGLETFLGSCAGLENEFQSAVPYERSVDARQVLLYLCYGSSLWRS